MRATSGLAATSGLVGAASDPTDRNRMRRLAVDDHFVHIQRRATTSMPEVRQRCGMRGRRRKMPTTT